MKRHAVGFLALVVALGGGGAYAASKIGGKRIKSRAIHARHIARHAVHLRHLGRDVLTHLGSPGGPPGPAGVRGPRGATGPRGFRGPTGARGPTGPTASTLASNHTSRGVWAVSGPTGAEGAVNYRLTLTFTPAGHFLAPGAPATTECPGSSTSPQAAAGQLCVYAADGSTTDVAIFAPAPGSAQLGFGLRTTGAGRASGFWAVRAP